MELGKVQGGIRVVSIIELMENLFGEDAFNWDGPSFKERTEKVREWLNENDSHYYADVKEDFSIYAGIKEAKENGKQIVVVENLS